MTAVIEARGLAKAYGATRALDGVSFSVEAGRIVGLIGPNGAGKTTALKAILGLTPFRGELQVLGLDPRTQRDELMREVCFMADVAVLPRWLRVSQALEVVGGVHPRFDRARATEFLSKTDIRMQSRVRELSKGMVTQLHLALILAIDARLLVLDEPTLGLDLLYRRKFYDTLGEDITNELVDWFNSVDATYRSDLRELNESNFARFDARLEQRVAELRRDLTMEITRAHNATVKWMFTFWLPTAVGITGTGIAVVAVLLRR